MEAVDHSNKDCRKENFKAGTEVSSPLKVQAFLLHQICQMRQWGMVFQTLPASHLPTLPAQHASKSSTSWGITQETPNKANTKSQSSWETGQCRRRWLTDSPPLLHIQHQSMIITFCFLRLSIVRILPNAAVYVKRNNWNHLIKAYVSLKTV